MSRTRYVAHCLACDANLRLTKIGSPCSSCGKPLSDGRDFRTPYAGGELVGAYGSGPKDAPWPEIKDGPLRGQNIVPSLKALKRHGRETGVTWQ